MCLRSGFWCSWKILMIGFRSHGNSPDLQWSPFQMHLQALLGPFVLPFAPQCLFADRVVTVVSILEARMASDEFSLAPWSVVCTKRVVKYLLNEGRNLQPFVNRSYAAFHCCNVARIGSLPLSLSRKYKRSSLWLPYNGSSQKWRHRRTSP